MKKSMYSKERRRKIDKEGDTTRTEVTEKEEMQLKMCYRSFKKTNVATATFTLLVSIY